MSKPHKIVWNEGMFLNPHHFQQSNNYLENLSQQRLDYLFPFTWGVYEVAYDLDAVKNGFFTLDKLKGIMPDGSFLDVGEIDPLPENRSFQDIFTPSTDSIDVYIGIPLYTPDKVVCNLDENDKTKTTRYRREYIQVSDENTASNEQSLSVAKKNIKVFFSGEALDGFSSIKIAKIDRLADGYAFDEDYIPPLLNIKASAFLLKMLRGLLENLSSRCTELSATRRQRSADMADFTPSDMSNFLFLQTINTFIPVLNHLYQAGAGHPEQLYKVLVQLSGALMTFSMKGHPRELPGYNHSDLTTTFDELDKKLQSLFGKVVSSQNFVAIPLEKRTENILVGNIKEEELFVSGSFFLAVAGGEISQADIIRFVPGKLKISSADTIVDLINAAMPGVGISHVPIPPPSFPVKVGYEYFKLEPTSELWPSIRETRSIAVYIPKDLVAIDSKLIILRG